VIESDYCTWHNELNFYSASSLKQQFGGTHYSNTEPDKQYLFYVVHKIFIWQICSIRGSKQDNDDLLLKLVLEILLFYRYSLLQIFKKNKHFSLLFFRMWELSLSIYKLLPFNWEICQKKFLLQTFNQSMISMIVLVYILLDISWLVYRISGEPWRYFQGQSSWNLHTKTFTCIRGKHCGWLKQLINSHLDNIIS
jgi:hypothetical protein